MHVSLYHSSTPLYIHAKAMSVNNTTVYVGSGNFTTTMTNDDRNAGTITTNPTVVRGITATMASDFAGATPYWAEEWLGSLLPAAKRQTAEREGYENRVPDVSRTYRSHGVKHVPELHTGSSAQLPTQCRRNADETPPHGPARLSRAEH